MADYWIQFRLFNMYFTGHQSTLVTLHERLVAQQMIAICGLDGIGKSELCLHYFGTYQSEYEAVIWLDASSGEKLTSDLNMLSKVAPELLIKLWVETDRTLLILDDVRDENLIHHLLPLSKWKGHLLLTTRYAPSRLPAFPMPVLTTEESTLLLLRRGRCIPQQGTLDDAPTADRQGAEELALELGGFPLVLNQAGARIALQFSFTHYLSTYRKQKRRMLKWQAMQKMEPTLVDIVEETLCLLPPASQHLLFTLAHDDAPDWPDHSSSPAWDDLLRLFLLQHEGNRLHMHRLVRTILRERPV